MGELTFLHSHSTKSLVSWLQEFGEPAYRARQIIDWVWRCGETDPNKMTNIGTSVRELLVASFVLEPLSLLHEVDSVDGETEKFLWELIDKRQVESVLIKAPGRGTICVSSQVGCPCRCSFCVSGASGLVRNLCSAEIVFQVLAIKKKMLRRQEKLTNIVYMGMGEPLENYDEVVSSIRMLSDPDLLGFSCRRITISTVGVVEKIRRLADEDIGVNLALSLHAPNQQLRQSIMPYARIYPLEDILHAVSFFREKTGRDVTYEYILLAGVNDEPRHAEELASLLQGRPGGVNLIPYNPVPPFPYHRPSKERVTAFREVLRRRGIVNTCRYTKGKDISAACGQLAMRKGRMDNV